MTDLEAVGIADVGSRSTSLARAQDHIYEVGSWL